MKTAAGIGLIALLVLLATGFQSALEARVGGLETRVAYLETFHPPMLSPSATNTFLPTLTPSATYTPIPTNTPRFTATQDILTNTPTQELATPRGLLGAAETLYPMNIRTACSASAPRMELAEVGRILLVLINRPETRDGYIWLPFADTSGRCVAWKRLDAQGNVVQTYLRTD